MSQKERKIERVSNRKKNENKLVQVTGHFAMNLVSFLWDNQEIEF